MKETLLWEAVTEEKAMNSIYGGLFLQGGGTIKGRKDEQRNEQSNGEDMGAKVLVIGLGNTIMSDDGLGVMAVRELGHRKSWAQGISILEVGTSVLDYIGEIGSATNLIAIDAITAGHPPGTIYRIEDFDGAEDIQFTDSHGVSLPEAVALAKMITGRPDKIIVFGIEPQCCDVGIGLSSSLKEALDKLITIVEREIHLLTVT